MAESTDETKAFSDDTSVSVMRRLVAQALEQHGLGHITVERYHEMVILTLSKKEAWELMTLLNSIEAR